MARSILRGIGTRARVPAGVRCVFSESMKVQTLEAAAGGPPGGVAYHPAATRSWRAVAHVLRSPGSWVNGLADDLLTTVFPGDCRVCGEPLVHAGTLPVCCSCLDGLSPRADTGCRRCGDRLNLARDLEDLSFRGMECLACRLAPPDFVRAVSFGTYEGALRELIHLLKYERMRSAARILGSHLAQAIATLEPETVKDLLVIAVPLFSKAERSRGYNQADLLAAEALRLLKRTHPSWKLEPVPGVLLRRRSTEHQFALSRRERRRNLAGAFVIEAESSNRLAGQEVLLIDDVLTTGATARECAKVLRRAGAEKVWVATVARACGAEERNGRLDDAVAGWDGQSLQH